MKLQALWQWYQSVRIAAKVNKGEKKDSHRPTSDCNVGVKIENGICENFAPWTALSKESLGSSFIAFLALHLSQKQYRGKLFLYFHNSAQVNKYERLDDISNHLYTPTKGAGSRLQISAEMTVLTKVIRSISNSIIDAIVIISCNARMIDDYNFLAIQVLFDCLHFYLLWTMTDLVLVQYASCRLQSLTIWIGIISVVHWCT